jgi:hypothetical protein
LATSIGSGRSASALDKPNIINEPWGISWPKKHKLNYSPNRSSNCTNTAWRSRRDADRFENAFQGVARMILGSDIEKVVVNGRTTYDFSIFRQGKKHVIGMYDEINSFVSYVKDAAEGGSSKEMAFVLVGEPGNGKTFSWTFCAPNTAPFCPGPRTANTPSASRGMDTMGSYGRISMIESQTYEDPMILAMNLFDDPERTRRTYPGNSVSMIRPSTRLYDNYRPWAHAADISGTISANPPAATSIKCSPWWTSSRCRSPKASAQ